LTEFATKKRIDSFNDEIGITTTHSLGEFIKCEHKPGRCSVWGQVCGLDVLSGGVQKRGWLWTQFHDCSSILFGVAPQRMYGTVFAGYHKQHALLVCFNFGNKLPIRARLQGGNV